jgi:hypothetical protein
MEKKLSLYYACIGVCFRISENHIVQVLVVEHKEDSKLEIRFPAGVGSFQDIILTVEIVIKNVNNLNKIKNFIILAEKDYTEKISSLNDRNEKNFLLNESLKEIFWKIKKIVNSKELDKILKKSRLITLQNKIKQETSGSNGKFYKADGIWLGYHERCVYVTTTVTAPERYTDSNDDEIIASYWVPISEIPDKISKKHLSYFHRVINTLSEIDDPIFVNIISAFQ